MMFTEEIERGMTFLDHTKPDWWELVHEDSLNMLLGNACVLGQVFAPDAAVTGAYDGYTYAALEFGALADPGDMSWYGFDISFDEDSMDMDLGEDEYALLRKEWIDALENRKAELS